MDNIIEVSGLKYRLQALPNRERIRLKQRIINVKTMQVDLEKLLDFAFEHCVISEGHTNQPTLDSCTADELEVWEKVLPNFCLNGKFIQPSTGSKNKNKK